VIDFPDRVPAPQASQKRSQEAALLWDSEEMLRALVTQGFFEMFECAHCLG